MESEHKKDTASAKSLARRLVREAELDPTHHQALAHRLAHAVLERRDDMLRTQAILDYLGAKARWYRSKGDLNTQAAVVEKLIEEIKLPSDPKSPFFDVAQGHLSASEVFGVKEPDGFHGRSIGEVLDGTDKLLAQLNEPCSRQAILDRLTNTSMLGPADDRDLHYNRLADELHRLHVRIGALLESAETASLTKLSIHALRMRVGLLEEQLQVAVAPGETVVQPSSTKGT